MNLRLPAKKLRIVDIVNGKYVEGNGIEKRPSYVITPLGIKASRVNIFGVVVDTFLNEEKTYGSLILNDGTEAIRVKLFKEKTKFIEKLSPGDKVLVIGKIRNFNGEIYVNGEVVRKVEEEGFEKYRKLELEKIEKKQRKVAEDLKILSEKIEFEELKKYAQEKYGMDEETLTFVLSFKTVEENNKEKVIELLKKLDEGDGVEIGKIFEVINLPEKLIEQIIDELWNEGKIYEPVPGKFKVVES